MKIAFMHIPKTGGISVERSLKAASGPDVTTCPVYYAPDFNGKTYDDLPGYNIYHGHFDQAFLSTVPSDYKRVVVLRTPADQVLSLCNHIASRDKHPLHEEAKASTLAQLLRNNQSLHNLMAKHLLGRARYKELLLRKMPVANKLEEAEAEVFANLRQFDVIGITPRLGRFMRDVGATIGADLPAPKKENKNKFITFAADALSEEDRDALKFASWADRPLYRAIWTKFLADRFAKPTQDA